MKCKDCNKTIKKDSDYIEIGDNKVCEECRESYFQCVYCSEWVEDSEGSIVEEEFYCNECFRNECFSCPDCGEYFKNEPNNSINWDFSVCDSCYQNYFECYGCSDLTHQDNANYCENCDNDFCDDCYPGHGCNDTRQYDGRIRYCSTTGKKIKIKRLIGLELEAEQGDRNELYLDEACGIDDDGSLDNGTEVKTPPREMADFESMVARTCKAMQNAGFEISKRCGLHVHIDARDIRDKYSKISNVFRTFYAIENVIYAMIPNERKTNDYCIPLTKDYSFFDISRKLKPDMIDKNWYKGDVNKSEHHHSSRYHGLNLHSVFYRGTIEFRYHSGTLNERKILNWVNFLLHATDWAINKYNYRNVRKLLRMKNNRRKFKMIMNLFRIDRNTRKYLEYRINLNSPTFFKQLKLDQEEI